MSHSICVGTTHFAGCECHEARRDAERDALAAEIVALRAHLADTLDAGAMTLPLEFYETPPSANAKLIERHRAAVALAEAVHKQTGPARMCFLVKARLKQYREALAAEKAT